jgi:hypothetical protein
MDCSNLCNNAKRVVYMDSIKNEKISEKIELTMKDYISTTNFQWNSDVFTSSSITKIVMKALKVQQTRFRLIHKIVRDILKKWAQKSYCIHIETTHYGHSQKTKMIVQFNNYGLTNLILIPEVLPLPI